MNHRRFFFAGFQPRSRKNNSIQLAANPLTHFNSLLSKSRHVHKIYLQTSKKNIRILKSRTFEFYRKNKHSNIWKKRTIEHRQFSENSNLAGKQM